jgi:dihydroflavonol-4-reductase
MKNILVTGAAGSLGHTIANQLIKEHHHVFGLIMPSERDNMLDSGVIRIIGDVLDETSLKNAFEQVGRHAVVIHCAGMISIDSKVGHRIYQVNVEGSKNIVALCQQYDVDQMIYVSSVHAITELEKGQIMSEPNEISAEKVFGHYSKSKAMATLHVMKQMKQGFPATIVYPSGIISDEDVKNAFMTQMVKDYLEKRMNVGIRGGYDFVDVRDVASAIITICDRKIINEHFILSNQYYTVMNMMDILYDLTGLKKVKTMIPLGLVKMVLPIKSALDQRNNRISLYTSDSIKILSSNSNFSHKKADRMLSYNPRDIKETFSNLIDNLSNSSL